MHLSLRTQLRVNAVLMMWMSAIFVGSGFILAVSIPAFVSMGITAAAAILHPVGLWIATVRAESGAKASTVSLLMILAAVPMVGAYLATTAWVIVVYPQNTMIGVANVILLLMNLVNALITRSVLRKLHPTTMG